MDIKFFYGHREKLEPEGERTHQFFSQFPNVDVRTEQLERDGAYPIGSVSGRYYFGYIGTAILSSATMAAAVKPSIQGRRRKIVISISGKDKRSQYARPGISYD